MKKSIYTITGNHDFDKMLEQHLKTIADAVKDLDAAGDIIAVLLGGGYGRGEGGVFINDDGKEKLYNDLDLFVICRNTSRQRIKKIDHSLKLLGDSFTDKIGVDVDFGPARTLKQLAKMPFTMMWQELREGHVVIYGDADVLNIIPEYDLKKLPFSEGVRLLLNRGAGLLLARQRLEERNYSGDDLDFIGRNLHKAILACGDVVLILHNQYSSDVSGRLALLKKYSGKKINAEDVDLYEQAVDFKLSPKIYAATELNELYCRALELFKNTCMYFFSVCYGQTINNLQEMNTAFEGKISSEKRLSLKRYLKNFIISLLYMHSFGWRVIVSGKDPRLKLLRVLLALLFEQCLINSYNKRIKEENFLVCWSKVN